MSGLDVRLGQTWARGGPRLSEEPWREARGLTLVWSLGPGDLEGTHSRLDQGQEGGWGLRPLVHQPAACQG